MCRNIQEYAGIYIYIGSPPVVCRVFCCFSGGDDDDGDRDDNSGDGKGQK